MKNIIMGACLLAALASIGNLGCKKKTAPPPPPPMMLIVISSSQ